MSPARVALLVIFASDKSWNSVKSSRTEMENFPGFIVSPLGVPTPPPEVPGPWSAIAAPAIKTALPVIPAHFILCILLWLRWDDLERGPVPVQAGYEQFSFPNHVPPRRAIKI